MGIYLHKFNTMSEFESNYEGSGYTEPWVSYTTETGATETVKTFTSNIPPDYHGYVSAFTGVFEYVGDYYAPYYDPSQGGDVYDLEWATMYYPVYTNGKKYVTTQNNNNEQEWVQRFYRLRLEAEGL